jgi:hypothetical protein
VKVSRAPELDSSALRADVERFAAIGPRFCGGPGEERARELLLAEFAATGLEEVGGEEYRYLGYEPVASRCEFGGGAEVGSGELSGGAVLPCVGLQSCADGIAEGEAVYVGGGEAAELEAVEAVGGSLAGRIAVLRTPMPAAVAPALIARGVAGLVLLSPTPDGLIGHFTASFYPPPEAPPWEGRVLPVPGVTVEAAAGERLLAALSAGPTGRYREHVSRNRPIDPSATVRIEHRAEYRELTAVNVVGEVPGTEWPDERIVVGAHYDTQLESPGAADNGAGLAALLGIARAFAAGVRPRRTVALVAFAGEELACWGATAYVRARAAEVPAAMVNLDAIGPPVLAKRTIVATPAIAPFAAAAARESGWEVEVEIAARDFPYSDLAPFAEAGVPACQIWRYPPPHPYYHSAGDTPRWVDYGLLAEDARAAAETVFRLAEEEQIPAGEGEASNPDRRRDHAA